jgi:lipid-A-disaccharide synthase
VDLLLALHAFDAPLFEQAGLKTIVVGNSALNRDVSGADPARFRAHVDAGPDQPILLLAPGSRPSEIARVLPPFGEAAAILAATHPGLKVVLPVAGPVAAQVREQVAAWPAAPVLVEDEALKQDAMAAATVALACSGTVTTELALAGCPMVVGYRIGPLTYQVLRRIVRTKWITLFNVAAGRTVAPELIQDACTGEALAHEAALRLDDPALRERQVAEQFAALEKMGRDGGDPAGKAAEAILSLLPLREKGKEKRAPVSRGPFRSGCRSP